MRLRIAIGSIFDVLYIVFIAILFYTIVGMVACPSEADAATLVLPFANQDNGFSTQLVLVNHGVLDAPVEHYFDTFGVGGGVVPVVPAKAAWRSLPRWPEAGVGVATVDVPDGIEAFVLIGTPAGSLIRIDALQPIDAAHQGELIGFPAPPDCQTFVFVGSVAGGRAIVVGADGLAEQWSQWRDLKAGEAAIFDVTNSREVVRQQGGEVYAFSYSWSPNGTVSVGAPTILSKPVFVP